MIAFRLGRWVGMACLLHACGGKAVTTGDGEDHSDDGNHQTPGDGDGFSATKPPGQKVASCLSGVRGASKVKGLNLAGSWDAVSWVQLTTEHLVDFVLEQQGEPCGGSVGSTCLLELNERKTGFYFAGSDVGQALIVSRDGEHEALGYGRLREVLGAIDTANEVAVIAWSEGWDVSCDDIWEDDEGYWIPDSEGCLPDGNWVRIFPDGSVSQSAHC